MSGGILGERLTLKRTDGTTVNDLDVGFGLGGFTSRIDVSMDGHWAAFQGRYPQADGGIGADSYLDSIERRQPLLVKHTKAKFCNPPFSDPAECLDNFQQFVPALWDSENRAVTFLQLLIDRPDPLNPTAKTRLIRVVPPNAIGSEVPVEGRWLLYARLDIVGNRFTAEQVPAFLLDLADCRTVARNPISFVVIADGPGDPNRCAGLPFGSTSNLRARGRTTSPTTQIGARSPGLSIGSGN